MLSHTLCIGPSSRSSGKESLWHLLGGVWVGGREEIMEYQQPWEGCFSERHSFHQQVFVIYKQSWYLAVLHQYGCIYQFSKYQNTSILTGKMSLPWAFHLCPGHAKPPVPLEFPKTKHPQNSVRPRTYEIHTWPHGGLQDSAPAPRLILCGKGHATDMGVNI